MKNTRRIFDFGNKISADVERRLLSGNGTHSCQVPESLQQSEMAESLFDLAQNIQVPFKIRYVISKHCPVGCPYMLEGEKWKLIFIHPGDLHLAAVNHAIHPVMDGYPYILSPTLEEMTEIMRDVGLKGVA